MAENALSKFIDSRQTSLDKLRKPWETHWQDIADFCSPVHENLLGTRPEGEKRGLLTYDGTAPGALNLFTDGFYGYTVSQAMDWFSFGLSNHWLEDMKPVREWLQMSEAAIYAALNRSNFYEVMWNYIYQNGGFGTSALYMEEDKNTGKIVFESVPIGQLYIAENRFGVVDVVHRKWKLSARKLVQKFGLNKVSEPIKNAYQNDPFREFEVLHCCYPREDRDATSLNAKNKKHASVWKEYGREKILLESGYDHSPYIVWRYLKDGWSPWGRGPASFALVDIMGVNEMERTILKAAQMSVEPPLNVPSEMRGHVNLKPRGLNYYDNPQRQIVPMQLGQNYAIGIDHLERKQKIIESRFHVDTFLLLSNNINRLKTAQEVVQLQGEKAAVLGAVVGRFNSEALDPIMDRIFEIEFAAGRIPQAPDIVLEYYAGGNIDVQYVGPLAQAQRSLYRTRGIDKGIGSIIPMLQINPEASDVINWDEAVKEVWRAAGAPEQTFKDPKEVEAVRQGRQQAAMQEEKAMQAQEMMQGMKTVSEVDKNTGGEIMNLIKKAGANAQA